MKSIDSRLRSLEASVGLMTTLGSIQDAKGIVFGRLQPGEMILETRRIAADLLAMQLSVPYPEGDPEGTRLEALFGQCL